MIATLSPWFILSHRPRGLWGGWQHFWWHLMNRILTIGTIKIFTTNKMKTSLDRICIQHRPESHPISIFCRTHQAWWYKTLWKRWLSSHVNPDFIANKAPLQFVFTVRAAVSFSQKGCLNIPYFTFIHPRGCSYIRTPLGWGDWGIVFFHRPYKEELIWDMRASGPSEISEREICLRMLRRHFQCTAPVCCSAVHYTQCTLQYTVLVHCNAF